MPVVLQQPTYRVTGNEVRRIPGVQATNTGEVGDASYSLVLENVTEAKRCNTLPLRFIDITLSQSNVTLMIIRHRGLEFSAVVDLLLQAGNQATRLFAINPVTDLWINQPE